MSENYSLNSQFGLNVAKGALGASSKAAKNVQSSNNFFESIKNLSEKYENVFNGNVEKEINMYSRQAMIVAMDLNAAETKHKFDTNI